MRLRTCEEYEQWAVDICFSPRDPEELWSFCKDIEFDYRMLPGWISKTKDEASGQLRLDFVN